MFPKASLESFEKLTTQINDEFLTCKICFETYQQPKCLSCLHTFCKVCIESNLISNAGSSNTTTRTYSRYRELACPICRKKTQIPFGGVSRLQDNFFIASLSDLVRKKPDQDKVGPNHLHCCFCSQLRDQKIDAIMKCMDCQKLLCDQCSESHRTNQLTSAHDLYELSIEKEIMCQSHPDETVRYFCEQCNYCVCVLCAQGPHFGHNLLNFHDSASKRRPEIISSLSLCRSRQTYLQEYLLTLSNFKEQLLRIRQDISTTASVFHNEINKQEADNLLILEKFIHEPTRHALENLDQAERYGEQLENTCSLCELMLNGNDIEFLLMAGQLSGKLETLSRKDLSPLSDDTITQLNFKQGSVDLGTLIINGQECREQASKLSTIAVQTDNRDFDLSMIDSGCDEMQLEPEDNDDDDQSFIEHESCSLNGMDQSSKSVKRLIKKNCSVIVLPLGDTVVLDPDSNTMSVLDKRGRTKALLTDGSNTNPLNVGVGSFKSTSISDSNILKEVKINTEQGILTISFKETQRASLPLAFTVHAYNSMALLEQ